MHYYLKYNQIDTKAIGEKFVKQYGQSALSNYAVYSMLEAEGKIPLSGKRVNWDSLPESVYRDVVKSRWDVVCEIVALYGRRGQFDKIKELLLK